jgi:hypothetical protein
MPVKCKMKRGKRRKGFGRRKRRPTGLAARLRRKRLKKAAVTLPKDIRLSPLLMPSQQFERQFPSWGCVGRGQRFNINIILKHPIMGARGQQIGVLFLWSAPTYLQCQVDLGLDDYRRK